MDKQNTTARGVIYDNQGKILMIERHKANQHYFVLPGGHAAPNEEPEAALAREIYEETGLNIDVQKLLYTSDDDIYHNDQRIYLCAYNGNAQPALRPDSIEAKLQAAGEPQRWQPGWFELSELKGSIVYPEGLIDYLEKDKAVNYIHNPYKIIERQVYNS